jgi:hypothetical protein
MRESPDYFFGCSSEWLAVRFVSRERRRVTQKLTGRPAAKKRRREPGPACWTNCGHQSFRKVARVLLQSRRCRATARSSPDATSLRAAAKSNNSIFERRRGFRSASASLNGL